MVEISYVIKDELGMHARPAGALVKYLGEISSKVIIKKGEKEVEANRLFALMGLAIKHGDEVTFKLEGENESEDSIKLKTFCEGNL